MTLPEIRAAAVFGLGCLVHSCPPDTDVHGVRGGVMAGGVPDHSLNMQPSEDRLPAEQLIANAVRQVGRVVELMSDPQLPLTNTFCMAFTFLGQKHHLIAPRRVNAPRGVNRTCNETNWVSGTKWVFDGWHVVPTHS